MKPMAEVTKLSEAELQQELSKLPGWTVAGGKLHREYKFPDFVHAFGFMAAAAATVESLQHHPEWTNVYNTVTVDLMTHDANGITTKDTQLAAKLDALAKKLAS